ncbi:MAG: GIY-YIG nuclease family protein [Gemmatimonas sp.]|nr:GIY-YIG nuclease family protein [Gemmatimonas sp.]
MKVADLFPTTEEKTAFELYSLSRISDSSGCYCLANAAGDILYIGQAVSIRQRLVQHFDSEKRMALTRFGRCSTAWWRAEDPARLNALERGWLESVRLRDGELPPLNRVSAPI